MKHIKTASENILFYSAFFVSRIPIWFVVLACLYSAFISPATALYIILAILVGRAYTEAELVNGGVIFLSAMQVLRIFIKIAFVISIYVAFLYFNLFAAPIDQILIAVALMICVGIFIDTGAVKKIGKFSIYFRGYHLTFLGSLVTTFFWLYLTFVPDSLFGNCLMVAAIYGVEFFTLFKRYELPEYALIDL